MKLWMRVCVISLGFGTIFLWMGMIRRPTHQEADSIQSDHEKTARRPFVTFDIFIHAQHLRKKKLRDFCGKFPEFTSVNASEGGEHLLSSLTVSPKLLMVHCKSPGGAFDQWEELIQAMEKGSDAGTWGALPEDHQPGTLHNKLRDYNLSTMEHVLRTYTKVLFVRDPFERLVSMYMQDHAGEITFDEFIEVILAMETSEGGDGVSASSMISLCHPCFIRYDYIVMYDFLEAELYHLINRIFSRQVILLPSPKDSKPKSPPKWLIENLFRGLSGQQRNQLSEIYSQDFAAFPLHGSLLWNHTE
ncbi:carbohydrate sulfotransferase 11-like isoform X2 [Pseudophryne corroboree]|uniref:carbohydrate sulfotransferase 11-like isoform X2 n=1 Tax=Pseudophryne corroboree TaxID=495146 RepID=UPI00308218A2